MVGELVGVGGIGIVVIPAAEFSQQPVGSSRRFRSNGG